MKTFTDFLASREFCYDLGKRFDAEFFEDSPRAGYVYMDGAGYIEMERDGTYYLILGRCEYKADALLELEPILFADLVTDAPDLFDVPEDVHAFLCALQEAMTSKLSPNAGDNFAKAMLANMREPHPTVCHMHDYCDANAVALGIARDNIDAAADLYHRARPILRGRA